jgi:triosephosphate isomerase
MFAKPIIVANWKMNCRLVEAVRLIGKVRRHIERKRLISTCVVCPPFTLLRDMADNIPGTGLKLGAQNCYFEPSGAYTGEISAEMLHDMACGFVILGHSERRMYFNEGSEAVLKKAVAAHKAKLTAVICVGETLFEHRNGMAKETVSQQIDYSVPEGATSSNLVIAYEPVWSIGTDAVPEPGEIEEMHRFIKERALKKMKNDRIGNVSVIYGGSVSADNAAAILSQRNVDGLLLGRASVDADEFIKILVIADVEANNKILVSD